MLARKWFEGWEEPIMTTIHCPECNDGVPCGHGHLYVIEFHSDAALHFINQPEKGYLYVGSTGKSVEQRFKDNFTRMDGVYVEPDELRISSKKWPEDGQWKYNTSNTKRIRKFYLRHRPDLLYSEKNPVILGTNDPGKLVRWEANLVRRLKNRGWHVEGPTR